MSDVAARLTIPRDVESLANRVAQAGGRLLVVGGWLRDALRGARAKDLDLEIYGLATAPASALLRAEGFTPPVGRQFAVWRRTRDGVDVAEPRVDRRRRDALAGPVNATPESIEAALRARDLTLNAMAFDPLSRVLYDPLGGQEDLEAHRLRAADRDRFGEDPLRVLRVARLAASLDATPEPELVELCRSLDLSDLPVERVAGELRRMLLEPLRPWRAIECLREMQQLGVFAPIEALIGVPQDPEWHPEGDVYVHTGRVVDRAAERARSLPPHQREVLLWGALCHDLGKPETTRVEADGRIRSLGHDEASARIARDWLGRLRVGDALRDACEALARHHLAPALLVAQGARPRAYRRLARKLDAAGLDARDLERVARADHLGRTTSDALAGRFEAGDRFLAEMRALHVESGPREDAVRAADWMRTGVPAGPELGRLLRSSRSVQDETGWHDVARIMDRVRALDDLRETDSSSHAAKLEDDDEND